MAETIIISANDVREFFPQLSTNIANNKIESSILLAQQNDLESFLGYYMYNDFIEDFTGSYVFTTPKYQTLFDGATYLHNSFNRYFRGVRHLLAVYSFVRLMGISDINLTESGLVDKVTEESEVQEQSQQRNSTRQIKDDAIRLEKDSQDYILAKISDFTLYHKRYSTDDYKTSYNFTPV